MDELRQRALERREQLRGELEAIERFIVELEQIQGSRAGNGSRRDQLNLWNGQSGRRSAHAASVRAMIDRAEQLIREAGRPLTRSQLVQQLGAEGHQILGTDKTKVFGTNMWRSGRFWNIKGAGYWPKSTSVPDEFASLPRQG